MRAIASSRSGCGMQYNMRGNPAGVKVSSTRTSSSWHPLSNGPNCVSSTTRRRVSMTSTGCVANTIGFSVANRWARPSFGIVAHDRNCAFMPRRMDSPPSTMRHITARSTSSTNWCGEAPTSMRSVITWEAYAVANPPCARSNPQSHPCSQGCTPLHLAAGNNQTEAAKLLVRHGADLNKLDGVITPPHMRRVMCDVLSSFDAQLPHWATAARAYPGRRARRLSGFRRAIRGRTNPVDWRCGWKWRDWRRRACVATGWMQVHACRCVRTPYSGKGMCARSSTQTAAREPSATATRSRKSSVCSVSDAFAGRLAPSWKESVPMCRRVVIPMPVPRWEEYVSGCNKRESVRENERNNETVADHWINSARYKQTCIVFS